MNNYIYNVSRFCKNAVTLSIVGIAATALVVGNRVHNFAYIGGPIHLREQLLELLAAVYTGQLELKNKHAIQEGGVCLCNDSFGYRHVRVDIYGHFHQVGGSGRLMEKRRASARYLTIDSRFSRAYSSACSVHRGH